MKQATLDLLDAELRAGHDGFMKLEDRKHWKNYRVTTVISPKYWTEHYPLIAQQTFSWVHVKYTDLPTHLESLKSNSTGIYYFYICPDGTLNDLPKFVFYVGISGEDGSNRPLRDRLRDYLYIDKVKKRENVHINLEMYYPVVYVCYSTMSLASAKLEELEVAFHGFFYPWAGRRDFPPPIKTPQKAWGGV
jgi:hypothetical protein